MFKTIKRLYKNNLTFKESSKIIPLTKLSILLILILNIFIFSFILTGISFQTKVVSNPNVEYPYECRDKEKCVGCREMRIKGLLCCQNCGEKIKDE